MCFFRSASVFAVYSQDRDGQEKARTFEWRRRFMCKWMELDCAAV